MVEQIYQDVSEKKHKTMHILQKVAYTCRYNNNMYYSILYSKLGN